jgi:hypothetical protein
MQRQRQILGALALALVVVGGMLAITGAERQDMAGMCVRIGLILGAAWLALPDLQRPDLQRPGAKWLFAAIGIFAFIVAKFPKLTIYAGIFLLALAILRPRIAAYANRRS